MKLNRNAFVLIVMLGLFCFGVGMACFGVCNTGIAYAIPGETQTVVLNWNGTFESEYGASISSDITATFDAQPEMVDVEIEGLGELSESSDAGVYVLTAKSSDPTYVFSNPTHLYTISPKTVSVIWGGTFESEYGESISSDITATFDAQPELVNIEIDGLSELSATSNADAYILTASIDSQNYTLTNATHIYTIKPKTMTVVWDGAFESEYGDAISGFTAKYNGVDATISGQPTQNSDAGSYVLTASTDNNNYTLINASHIYTIKPKAITVVWNGVFESKYGSKIEDISAALAQAPQGLNVTIEGLNQLSESAKVGTYILKAEVNNKNYSLINATAAYTILDTTAENQLKDKANTNIVLIVVLALLGAIAVVAIVIIVIKYAKSPPVDPDDIDRYRPPRVENDPTWKDLYGIAVNLEIGSEPAEGEVDTPFYDHVRTVAKIFQEGIIAHSEEIPIVEGETYFDPIYHETVNEKDEPISGNVVLKVVEPGMTIDGHVVVKAKVKC